MRAMKILVVFCVVMGTFETDNLPSYHSWQELFISPLFADVVTTFTDENFLDVLVPAECFDRNQKTIDRFLRNLPIPVRFFTDIGKSSVGGRAGTLMYRMYHLVMLVCDYTSWHVHVDDDSLEHALFHHFMKLYVIPEVYVTKDPQRNLTLPSKFVEHPGVNLTMVNGTVVFKDEYEEGCLTCAESRYFAKLPEFKKTLTVNKAIFHGWCTVPYTCSQHIFTTLVDALRYRNATVKIIGVEDIWRPTEHAMNALSHGNVFVELSQHFEFWDDFAHTRRPYFFDSTGYWFLVKGPQPIPKEEILVLPFAGNVWAALLASMALCFLITALITYAHKMTSVKISRVISLLFSTLLQQSEPLPWQLMNNHSFRILLGMWALLVLVMATAFKGCLVSLLRDVPLRGHVPVFWSTRTLMRQGYRICIITSHLGFFHVTYLARSLRTDEKLLMCQTRKAFNILNDGRDSFLIRAFPFGRYETMRRAVQALGFVETRREALTGFEGPLMQASSPYLKDFGKVVSRGVMSGLYARARALEAFKANYRRSKTTVVHGTESRLTVHDLRPYFLVWSAGIVLSLVVFLVEVCRIGRSRRRSRRDLRHRRAWKRRMN